MKTKPAFGLYLLLLGIRSTTRVFAQAPDSLAGKVSHDQGEGSLRQSWACIASLKADGRASFVLNSTGSTLNLKAQGVPFITMPQEDGTWSYQKNGASTGVLTLIDAKAVTDVIDLTFTSTSSGSCGVRASPNSFRGPGGGAFTLTDQASADAAPLINMSLRGPVSPGMR